MQQTNKTKKEKSIIFWVRAQGNVTYRKKGKRKNNINKRKRCFEAKSFHNRQVKLAMYVLAQIHNAGTRKKENDNTR